MCGFFFVNFCFTFAKKLDMACYFNSMKSIKALCGKPVGSHSRGYNVDNTWTDILNFQLKNSPCYCQLCGRKEGNKRKATTIWDENRGIEIALGNTTQLTTATLGMVGHDSRVDLTICKACAARIEVEEHSFIALIRFSVGKQPNFSTWRFRRKNEDSIGFRLVNLVSSKDNAFASGGVRVGRTFLEVESQNLLSLSSTSTEILDKAKRIVMAMSRDVHEHCKLAKQIENDGDYRYIH